MWDSIEKEEWVSTQQHARVTRVSHRSSFFVSDFRLDVTAGVSRAGVYV